MFERMEPKQIRELIRGGGWRNPTSGLAPGYAQANLVILPQKYAFDFLLFTQRNPKPCPVLEVTDPGSPFPTLTAQGADLRTDIPKYRIYRNGLLEDEVYSIKEYWAQDLVSFLIGCSFTFENALNEAGVPVRHVEERKNVPMYITNIMCKPAGIFHGPMVVSMRPMPADKVIRAIQVTSRYPAVHGAPVHIGDPQRIGIKDISKPDFGESVTILPDEIPVFWACGVTTQVAVMQAKLDLVITHSPGHMFITDLEDKNLAIF